MNAAANSPTWPLPPGIYRGTVQGVESGYCTARIAVRPGPGGCRIVDYEAVSDAHGLQHIEHAILTDDALFVAFDEARGVIEFRAGGDGVYRAVGEREMQVHVGYDGATLTWAWHWGTGGDDVVERSRATCARTDC